MTTAQKVISLVVFTLSIGITAQPAAATGANCSAAVIAPNDIDSLNSQNCDLTGATIILSDGSSLAVPEPGQGISMANATEIGSSGVREANLMVSPDGEIALIVDGREFGSAAAVEYFDAGTALLAVPSTACNNSSYALLGRRWQGLNYSWWYNQARQPVSGLTRISAGVSMMASGVTRCGSTIANGAVSSYNGATTASLSVTAAGCLTSNDGKSTLGWTLIDGSVLARTCTYYILGAILDADIAFDPSYTWYNSSSITLCSGTQYDLQQIATHEAGHAFGLGHVAQSTEQIMKPTFGYCETTSRSLGLGDATGMKVLYG